MNASRSYDSARCSTYEACVTACRRRSSGSSASSSASVSALDLRGMGGDEVRGLADREDLGCLLVGDPDAVVVLELDDQLDQVERVGLQVLLEARLLTDAVRPHAQFGGQVLPDAFEDLLSFHPCSLRVELVASRRTEGDASSGDGPQHACGVEGGARPADHVLVHGTPRELDRVFDARWAEASMRHHDG